MNVTTTPRIYDFYGLIGTVGFPGSSDGKESACNAGDLGLIPICVSEVSIFLLAILIPACASSSPAFLMMYSAYKLNKQGDNIQP